MEESEVHIIECPDDPEHRLEPWHEGDGYSDWTCLDCGKEFTKEF